MPITTHLSDGYVNALGLMSGTSLDGVDAALIRTDGTAIAAHGPSLTLPYTAELRLRLRNLLDNAPDLTPDNAELRAVEQALTLVHAQAVQRLRQMAPDMAVDVVGFHGQTILHRPGRTWQIGDAAYLSAQTDLPVVHDFRTADVAAGGEGAPLVPLYHAALLHNRPGPVAVLNIGGVANLTLVTGDGRIIACDTGPGNALLDDWACQHTGTPCDTDGQLARRGKADQAIVERLLAHPFFRKPAPKSLDRLSFHDALAQIAALDAADGAATLTAFTAQTIARTPLPEQPREWFICGGGRHNPALMAALAQALPGTIYPAEQLGWSGDALEAECFGFLAVRSLAGLPLSLPTTTGVPFPQTGGRLTCMDITPWGRRLWPCSHTDSPPPPF
ncbi:anhydro-N-acetylmuramic acid kinase [Acetobacter lambici]|uniref:Anhydro-N-acetylmuramic acid kinase n=1 Tax=Acetobacter lambici TaxID=1332824 RepID=A0ABT1F5H3_9PROT|nr:anhydro-N-acetylmuramic acid kinase [Acetobacter lambici]MCP1243451.1 anhydro-N-acetylmuramic acid kinase [Acetobacter lambici]MCP1259378.1 anhydro-N-acetylmuramic acid kinase [Acetobacter lambici]NHO57631.1 anhydro-N-acetylmuramic acid kinase [Acetobacter lambici]